MLGPRHMGNYWTWACTKSQCWPVWMEGRNLDRESAVEGLTSGTHHFVSATFLLLSAVHKRECRRHEAKTGDWIPGCLSLKEHERSPSLIPTCLRESLRTADSDSEGNGELINKLAVPLISSKQVVKEGIRTYSLGGLWLAKCLQERRGKQHNS